MIIFIYYIIYYSCYRLFTKMRYILKKQQNNQIGDKNHDNYKIICRLKIRFFESQRMSTTWYEMF